MTLKCKSSSDENKDCASKLIFLKEKKGTFAEFLILKSELFNLWMKDETKKLRCIFDHWSKLYFSLDKTKPEIQILN